MADLDTLRTLAGKATPGPWRENAEGKTHMLVGDGMWFARLKWTVIGPRNNADAAHISACDPQTILALLDENERLRTLLKPFAEDGAHSYSPLQHFAAVRQYFQQRARSGPHP